MCHCVPRDQVGAPGRQRHGRCRDSLHGLSGVPARSLAVQAGMCCRTPLIKGHGNTYLERNKRCRTTQGRHTGSKSRHSSTHPNCNALRSVGHPLFAQGSGRVPVVFLCFTYVWMIDTG